MAHKWDPTCPAPNGLVTPVRRDATGRTGPTPGQARGPRWRLTTPGSAGNLRALPDSRLLRDRLDPDEVVMVHGIPCTVRLRALFDEMRLAEDARQTSVEWTLQPPPGWATPLCLDDVLALRAEAEASGSARMC